MAHVHHYPVLISKATVESAGGKTSFPGDWSISRKLNGKPDKLLSFCLHVLTFAYTSLPTIDLTILEFRTQWLSREFQANRWLSISFFFVLLLDRSTQFWLNVKQLDFEYLSSTYRFWKQIKVLWTNWTENLRNHNCNTFNLLNKELVAHTCNNR